jgi:hypothetical protein
VLTAIVRNENTNEVVGALVAAPKTFRTGSRGFFGSGKIEIDGKRYQAQIQLVEIGSKADGEEQEAEA